MNKNKSFSLSFTCSNCGKPISKTSKEFGMDCENDCGKKAMEKNEEGLFITAGVKKE